MNQEFLLEIIARIFKCKTGNISGLSALKKGMTNRSYQFIVNGEKYIIRIPGEGTDKLINREDEARVYQAISGRGFCDEPVYLDPISGIKISRYIENSRTCDPYNEDDLWKCMKKLKELHKSGIYVPHRFDIIERMKYYESLRNGRKSKYSDYEDTERKLSNWRDM